MPKMKALGFRLSKRPETPDTDTLDIFDDIGEIEDWDGELTGFGPKKLSSLLAESKAQNLTVRINSNGGDLFEGMAVHNMLKSCGKNVTTTVTGIAASAASIIAMAGSKVQMHDASMLMIHNAWTFALGNSKELRKVADDMDAAMESAKKVYLNKAGSKLPADKLTSLLDAESYLSADECLELGLCDEILDKNEPDPVDDEPEEDPEPEDNAKSIEDSTGTKFTASKPVKKNWFF